MSDPSAFGFGPFVPGFDFLQKLAKSASAPGTGAAAMPGMTSWVAPTLSVEELDKRIQELKAVQFWLEQNGTALKATIQALEVQKMTLSTLQGMNVNMAELAKAFTARAPEPAAPAAWGGAAAAPSPAPAPAAPAPTAPAPAPEAAAQTRAEAKGRRAAGAAPAAPAAGAAVDPMQWWGSLTQQFQNIAAAAMQDVAAQALKNPAPAAAGKKSAAARSASPQAAGPSSAARKSASKAAAPRSRARKAPASKTRPSRP